jgi:glutamyl-Q tRNA(Asp) synthetase
MTTRFRFAPSPNGLLHKGHAFSALTNQALAARLGGEVLLRIEDIDTARVRPEFERAIVDDLHWIGFDWTGDVRRQSEHFDAYAQALGKLDALGLIYPAFETRAELKSLAGDNPRRDPDGAPLYTGAARVSSEDERQSRIASGAPYALRLAVDKALALTGPLVFREWDGRDTEQVITADPSAFGDVILARKEVPTSYHLSVVVDDALQGISHVVRGADLFHATSVHRLLQVLLGLPGPVYHHHQLVMDEAGEKLAKSRSSESLRALREAGLNAERLRRDLGF